MSGEETRRGGTGEVVWWGVVVLLVGVSLGLVGWNAGGRTGLWLDEVYSLELSRGEGYGHRGVELGEATTWEALDRTRVSTGVNVGGVWRGQQEDSHPPLYFVGLQFWRWVVGGGEWAARVFSAVAWVGVLVAVAVGGRMLGGRGGGLVACGVVAVAGPGVWYASEIRGYALGMWWVSMAVVGYVGAVRGEGKRWAWVAAAGLVGGAAGLTHYFCAGAVVGAWVGAMLAAPRGRRAGLVWSAVGVAGVYAVVWGPGLVAQLGVSAGYSGWIVPDSVVGVWSLVGSALGMGVTVVGGPAAWAWVGGSVLVGAMVWVAWKRGGAGWAVVMSVVGAMGLPLVADLAMGSVHVWQVRYGLFVLPGMAMGVGMLWGAGGRWKWVAGVWVVMAVLGNLERRQTETDWLSVTRGMGELVREVSGEVDYLVVVERAGEEASRRDVETDVRLLALLVAANGQSPAAGKVVLLDKPDPAAVGQLGSEVVMVTGWRQGAVEGYLPGYEVRGVRVWPGLGVRVVALRRGGGWGSGGGVGRGGGRQ